MIYSKAISNFDKFTVGDAFSARLTCEDDILLCRRNAGLEVVSLKAVGSSLKKARGRPPKHLDVEDRRLLNLYPNP